MNDQVLGSAPVAFGPITATVEVTAAADVAWRVFVDELPTWWPLDRLSIAADEESEHTVTDVRFEPPAGGRVVEVTSDGGEVEWARILTWDPPSRLVLAWRPVRSPTNPPTELEIRFTPTFGGTRVNLEHRGWERLGDIAAVARQSYGDNWQRVLERYAGVAAGAESIDAS